MFAMHKKLLNWKFLLDEWKFKKFNSFKFRVNHSFGQKKRPSRLRWILLPVFSPHIFLQSSLKLFLLSTFSTTWHEVESNVVDESESEKRSKYWAFFEFKEKKNVEWILNACVDSGVLGKREREKNFFFLFKGRVNEKEMGKRRKKKYLNNSHKILLAWKKVVFLLWKSFVFVRERDSKQQGLMKGESNENSWRANFEKGFC